MMYIKLLGAGMIVGASFWTGLQAARLLRRSHRHLVELAAALDTAECEIRFSRTGCADLFRSISKRFSGQVGVFFAEIAGSCSSGETAGPGMTARALKAAGLRLPQELMLSMERLVDSFGAYDVDGQLRLLAATRRELDRSAALVQEQLDSRCKTYEVLGLCTGAALMILVI